MRNNLPSRIWTNESGIINLDDAAGAGTHWTAYIKRGTRIVYFDSIGNLTPPLEVLKYFRSDGSSNTVTYNSDRFQSLRSDNCGHLCLMFLYSHSTTE